MDLFNTTLKLQQVSQEVVFKFCWKNKTKTRRPQITSESFCDWTWEQIQPGFEMFWPGGPALTNSLRMDVNSRSERGPTHTAGAQLNRKKTKKNTQPCTGGLTKTDRQAASLWGTWRSCQRQSLCVNCSMLLYETLSACSVSFDLHLWLLFLDLDLNWIPNETLPLKERPRKRCAATLSLECPI